MFKVETALLDKIRMAFASDELVFAGPRMQNGCGNCSFICACNCTGGCMQTCSGKRRA